MKHYLKYLIGGLLALVVTFSLTGCGDDSNSTAATGPASSSSFEGTSITFNPTINFLAGNTMTYLNTTAGSSFPAAATATNGTYSYTPNASFTSGTLTLNIDGVAQPVVIEISDFRRSGNNVIGFTASSGGKSFPVTVTGTLVAKSTTSTSTGSGTTPSLAAGETEATDMPGTVLGSRALVFFKSTETTAGVPADGTQTTFVIAARSLTFNGRTLSNPVFFNGNNQEWLFKDGSITYALSVSSIGGLNEINIYGPVGGSGFFGQYRAASPVTLSAGKLSSTTITASLSFVNTPPGFPAASALTAGSTGTFVFGTGTVTFDGVTFNFDHIDDFSPTLGFHYYTATVGGHTDTVSVGVNTAGGNAFITFITVERIRTADAPASGTVTGSFFFGVN